MVRAAALILALAFGGPAIASGSQIGKKTAHVTIEGRQYRVTTTADGYVTVARKAFIHRYDIREREFYRRAVVQATGCRVIDELNDGDLTFRFIGKLDCPKKD